MDNELGKLVKKRRHLRGAVTTTINKIRTQLADPALDIEDLENSLALLKERADELKPVERNIENLTKIDDLDKELASAEEYREKITAFTFKVNKRL